MTCNRYHCCRHPEVHKVVGCLRVSIYQQELKLPVHREAVTINGKGSATLTRIMSCPILRKSRAALTRIAREPYFDFIRDKENVPCFEFLTDAKIQKL